MPDEATLRALFTRDHLQRAAANPRSPTSVLSFFFALDFGDEAEVQRGLRDGHCVLDMRETWFFGPSHFDELCLPFRALIHAAGKGELEGPSGTRRSTGRWRS